MRGDITSGKKHYMRPIGNTRCEIESKAGKKEHLRCRGAISFRGQKKAKPSEAAWQADRELLEREHLALMGGCRASSEYTPGSKVSEADLWRGFSRCLSRGADSAAAPVDGSLRRRATYRRVRDLSGEWRPRYWRDRRRPERGGWRRCRMRRQKGTRKRFVRLIPPMARTGMFTELQT